MRFPRCIATIVASLVLAVGVQAAFVVDYTFDAGGNTSDALNGLAARATFDLTGTHLTILLQNTSTGVPASFVGADSLVVTLGMNLPAGIDFASGDTAVVGPDSMGLGTWTGRTPGTSVAEQWLWTNDYGGDLMNHDQPLATRQIISTSDGQDGGITTMFGGGSGNVDGPYGGIAAAPPILSLSNTKPAVSNSILFTLTLTAPITENELAAVAAGGVIEFGSDQRYLTTHRVPEPAALALLASGLAILRRRG